MNYQILEGHCSDVTWCDFKGSNLLVSSSNDKTIRIWKEDDDKFREDKTGSLQSPLIGHKYGVNRVCFSPFGTILASVSTDGYIFLWNVQTGEQVVRLKHPTFSPIRVCSFTPSSSIMTTAGDDETICLWDISTKSLIRCLDAHESMITTCSFTPDSAYLISGSTLGDLKLWDAGLGHGKYLGTVTMAHDLGVMGTDFSPIYEMDATSGSDKNLYLLASCGNDDLVKLWHVKSNGSIDLFRSLKGHTGNVNCVVFAKSGSLLASASGDKTIILWSAESGTITRQLEGHSRYVTCCCFSSDDKYLASGSNDKTVIIWKLDSCEYQPNNKNKYTKIQPIINNNNNASAVSNWSVDQVANWITSLGLEEYVPSFRDNQIDGAELLHLSHDVLLTGIKIKSLGHRNKILRAVQGLKNPLWQHIALNDDVNSIPDELLCPITHEIMREPVVAFDGYTYEKSAILEWFTNGNSTSPMTNKSLENKILIPNLSLKLLIQRYTA